MNVLRRRLILSFLVIGVALVMGCNRQSTSEEAVETTATESVAEQTAVTGREKNEGRATNELIRRLEKRVTFTDEQKTAIRSIAAAHYLDNLPKEQRQAAVQKIIAEIRTKVLTPEQVEIMKDGIGKDNDGSNE